VHLAGSGGLRWDRGAAISWGRALRGGSIRVGALREGAAFVPGFSSGGSGGIRPRSAPVVSSCRGPPYVGPLRRGLRHPGSPAHWLIVDFGTTGFGWSGRIGAVWISALWSPGALPASYGLGVWAARASLGPRHLGALLGWVYGGRGYVCYGWAQCFGGFGYRRYGRRVRGSRALRPQRSWQPGIS
jgi:hypothetical protein